MILDSNDSVLYINQYFAEAIMETSPQHIIGKTFSQCMREAYEQERGLHFETEDIEDWLQRANNKRWKQIFRSFQVDLLNGRWFLVTEQVIGGRFLFVHATDITRTKALEQELRKTQSKLLEHAYKDELTSIPNRRAFIKRTTEEINKAHRNHNPLTLALFDVDHFKRINDRFGHLAGDMVLQSLCHLVESQLRDYDIVARIGGEEFAIIFSDTGQEESTITVERIRTLIEKADFQFEDHVIHCTASFGVTKLKAEDSLESFMGRADKHLYLAKTKGRNRTISE